MNVDVWLAPLDLDDDRRSEFRSWLSPSETRSAEALGSAQLRERYIADHGWRRRLLGERMGRAPGKVAYVISPEGKPRPDAGGPHLSASRSGGRGLYAICEEVEVGVDLERIGEVGEVEAIVRRIASPAERSAFETAAPTRRAAAGYACWTRKEAYVKAAGTGLVFPLTGVEVWVGDDRPVIHGEIVVRTLDAGPGWAAALAVAASAPESVSAPDRPRQLE